jgi:hypothetical protein
VLHVTFLALKIVFEEALGLLENLCMPQIAGRLLRTLFNKLGVEENEE